MFLIYLLTREYPTEILFVNLSSESNDDTVYLKSNHFDS